MKFKELLIFKTLKSISNYLLYVPIYFSKRLGKAAKQIMDYVGLSEGGFEISPGCNLNFQNIPSLDSNNPLSI